MKRNKWFIIIAITMLVLSNVCCDDGGGDNVPDTGVDDADELIEDVADAAENVDDTLDTMWCLGSVNDWEIRCGGDGVKPTD